ENYRNKKIWETFTPHPTKDKSQKGEAAFREQTRIADRDPQDRADAMARLTQSMILSSLTPRIKDTLEDETLDGLNAQEIYNEGMLDYFEDVQFALDEVYGPGAVDFLDENMTLDVSPRKWHGGDADGKPIPATVLFNQRVLGALRAVEI